MLQKKLRFSIHAFIEILVEPIRWWSGTYLRAIFVRFGMENKLNATATGVANPLNKNYNRYSATFCDYFL